LVVRFGRAIGDSLLSAAKNLTRYQHIATSCRADDVTAMHHIRFFRSYVMAGTTESDWLLYFTSG